MKEKNKSKDEKEQPREREIGEEEIQTIKGICISLKDVRERQKTD